jgi:hypothetical protein
VISFKGFKITAISMYLKSSNSGIGLLTDVTFLLFLLKILIQCRYPPCPAGLERLLKEDPGRV